MLVYNPYLSILLVFQTVKKQQLVYIYLKLIKQYIWLNFVVIIALKQLKLPKDEKIAFLYFCNFIFFFSKRTIRYTCTLPRGLQYCSNKYQILLDSNGIQASMTEKYDPYENAIAERVNGVLKQEFDIDKYNVALSLKKKGSVKQLAYIINLDHTDLTYA